MGYNVRITESTARIPAANLQRAYEKMCALNVTHHNQKRGAGWSNGEQTGAWFSWMDANYPETCENAEEVLTMLGFECEYNTNGDLLIVDYDSKTGQEELFLNSITDDVDGIIDWVGEDGNTWTWEFNACDVIEQAASPLLIAAK